MLMCSAYVIFVGASDNIVDDEQYGIAAQAPTNSNFEYYGYTFAGEIANAMWSNALRMAQRGKTPVYGVGDKHEFSSEWRSLFRTRWGTCSAGARHERTASFMSYQYALWSGGFPNQAFDDVELRDDLSSNFYRATQNPYMELRNSFLNQNAQHLSGPGYPNGYPYKPLVDEAWQFIAPKKSAPPASLGTAASLSVTQIAASVSSGFGSVQQSALFNYLVQQLGVSPTQAQLLTRDVLTTLGLDGGDLANLLLRPNQPATRHRVVSTCRVLHACPTEHSLATSRFHSRFNPLGCSVRYAQSKRSGRHRSLHTRIHAGPTDGWRCL